LYSSRSKSKPLQSYTDRSNNKLIKNGFLKVIEGKLEIKLEGKIIVTQTMRIKCTVLKGEHAAPITVWYRLLDGSQSPLDESRACK